MPTTTKTVLPLAQYADLTRISPSMDVPANLLAFTLRMNSTEYVNPALTCTVSVDESFDGGVTWQNVVGFESVGGHDRLGNPLQPKIRVDLTNEQRAAALMKATIACSGSWRYGFLLDLET